MPLGGKRLNTTRYDPLWQGLPAHLRVLYVCDHQRTGGWLADAFASDAAVEVDLHESVGALAALARLRDELFDVVFVTHEPGELDALELVEGCRAAGADEPLIVLGHQSEQEMAVLCYEAGADGYVCVNTGTTRGLIWLAAKALQRCQLVRQNRRLLQAEKQRLRREQEEAERLLRQQQSLIGDLERLRTADQSANLADLESGGFPADRPITPATGDFIPAPPDLPQTLISHYRELLRAYVIMGTGNLAAELRPLAEVLVTAAVSPRDVMRLHVHVAAELIHGLGSRSSRHVITRADLLVVEIMIHMAEAYRARYRESCRPPVQLLLPGTEDFVAASTE